MSSKIFHGKVYILITGASQGIGAKIANIFSQNLDDGSHMLLLARNVVKLQETANSLPKNISVNFCGVDLSSAKADELKEIINNDLKKFPTNQYDQAVIVHNAGSVGDVSQATIDMIDFDYWNKYFDLNVFSPAVLNGVFMKIFNVDNVKKHVINITSLCGIQPMKSVGYYCTGKAAREMFFKVFAEENPNVNVLNYSPGPVDTDMLDTISTNVGDADTKKAFKKMKDDKTVLSTDQTINKLCQVLIKKKYKSGDHIDYFDEL